MHSITRGTGHLTLPSINAHHSMLPFDLRTLNGLPAAFKRIAAAMLRDVVHTGGTAFFTIHGKQLRAGETLRRPGPHTDGNYDRTILDWNNGQGGWKVGENGPPVGSADHARLYESENGGIITVSDVPACVGWLGQFEGLPGVGGDCSHLNLPPPSLLLEPNVVYYGNNHFIHESVPVQRDCHRTFARITLPPHHRYN